MRTPQYALLRELPRGLSARQRIYRCLSGGHIEPFADVEFLSAVATLERQGRLTRLYGGLPPYMAFAAPSGFLGRQLAHDRQPRGRTAAAGTPGDALRYLADVGVPASRTRLLVSDAFFGKRDSLPEFAARRPPR